MSRQGPPFLDQLWVSKRNVSLRHWLPVGHFDFKSQVGDHFPGFRRSLAGGGEVAADAQGIGYVEGQRLDGPVVELPSPRHSTLGPVAPQTEPAYQPQS